VSDSGDARVRVLIAASGSGGHLLPAVFIANAIQKEAPNAEIQFVGSGRPLEEKVIVARGFKRTVVELTGLKGLGVVGLFKFLVRLPKALLSVWRLLGEFRPHVVIGVGGYVSVLPVLAARLRGIPTWIHEAELNPGMANSFLGRFSSRVSVAYEKTTIGSSGSRVHTGHPVRPEMADVKPVSTEAPKNLLVLGGSQGAKSLDRTLASLAPKLKELGVNVMHQSRADQVSGLEEAYGRAGVQAKVFSFTDDMVGAYSWSDVIVARSGAGLVLEIGVSGRPAIFVPLPNSQGGHQIINAEMLEKPGRALIVLEGDDFEGRLLGALSGILKPDNYRKMCAVRIESRGLTAAGAIAKGVLQLSKGCQLDLIP
jgi:UDP-N-acetylglucosamine--N-acetylmuramyl-(pentapeptide) pyrophosphoryl-undecaprenol N-acetylglucosamine transferase